MFRCGARSTKCFVYWKKSHSRVANVPSCFASMNSNFGTKSLVKNRTCNPNLPQNVHRAYFGTYPSRNGLFDTWKSKEQSVVSEKTYSFDGDEAFLENTDEVILENPTQESMIESVSSDTDVVMQFADYGLGGGILPHKLFQDILNYLTTNMDMEWIPAIAILTVCLRCLTLPCLIYIRRFSARTYNLFPQTAKLQKNIADASQSGNKILYKKATMEYMDFMRTHKINPIKPLLINAPNAIAFCSMFYGIRQICLAKLPSLTTGGALWFQNLSIADPYYILPICSCLSMSMIIRYGGAEAEMGAVASQESFRNFLKWIPIISLPYLIFQPSAMFAFWIVSNTFTVSMMFLFRNKSVSKFCGIPERVAHDKSTIEELSKAMNPIELWKRKKAENRERQELAEKINKYQSLISDMEKMNSKKKRDL